MAEAEAAMKMLKNTKRELKDDLNIKALSLVIDRQKCMAIRLNFPYHTRCVCSTAKEDEAQVNQSHNDLCKATMFILRWTLEGFSAVWK